MSASSGSAFQPELEPDTSVVVAGSGRVGKSAAAALLRLGVRVTVLDESDDEAARGRAAALEQQGALVRVGSAAVLPPDAGVLVVSPGIPPTSPLIRQAEAAGVPVWGDIELAWRLSQRPNAFGAHMPPAAWLCVTGTNGKTTTVRMLEAMLRAARVPSVAAGNVGLPMVDVVLPPDRPQSSAPAVTAAPYAAIAAELSSFQLHYSSSVSVTAGALLNLAADHLDWHGGYEPYVVAKSKVFDGATAACVINAADPETGRMLELARAEGRVPDNCPTVSFTLTEPAPGQFGVRAGQLVDRAFGDAGEGGEDGVVLADVADVRPAAPHNVENALAAAALARAYGVAPEAVRAGLQAFVAEPHRIVEVGAIDGVTYVNDSKATNPHAAAASLRAFDRIVWIAGGLAKGAEFDQLVTSARERLCGVVLLGCDRATIRAALARNAPDVPVREIARTDAGSMAEIVAAATELAGPAGPAGDLPTTVLLAPACASMDMFTDYSARGDAFAAEVAALGTSA